MELIPPNRKKINNPAYQKAYYTQVLSPKLKAQRAEKQIKCLLGEVLPQIKELVKFSEK